MVTEEQILRSTRGSVIAPAGCGKTDLIVRSVASHDGSGRFLILTHTHAGVRALRSRFRRLGVDKSKFTIETIAGWSLGYARSYPVSSNLPSSMPTGAEWNQVYEGATHLLSIPAIQKVLEASYVGVFVDEYQDCTTTQHSLVCAIAEVLPVNILGDPLQGIFGFAGGFVPWADVETAFPTLGSLDYPWRWHDKNMELGEWLLSIRPQLMRGEPIDLRTAPMDWRQHSQEAQVASALRLLGHEQHVVAIRIRANQAHDFARKVGRAYVSMEELECKDLRLFMHKMDSREGLARAVEIIKFGKECISGLAPNVKSILDAFDDDRLPVAARIRDENKRALLETLILATQSTDHALVRKSLSLLEKLGTRIFRRELWQAALSALDSFVPGDENTLVGAAWIVRNRSRYIDRDLGRSIASRTLLIKGLEFDHAFIPVIDEFTGVDAAKHFTWQQLEARAR